MDKRSFVLGIAFSLLMVGCMMAVTNTNGSTGARYEVHWELESYGGATQYVVLDTQTGTTVVWSDSPTGQARLFDPGK